MRTNLATLLKQLRHQRGWSLRQAAEETRGAVSHATISELERGSLVNPHIKTLQALARVYGLTVGDLLGETAATK